MEAEIKIENKILALLRKHFFGFEIYILFLILFFISTHQSAFSFEAPIYTLEEVKVVFPAKGADFEKISQEVKVIKKEELLEFGPERRFFQRLNLKKEVPLGFKLIFLLEEQVLNKIWLFLKV